MVPSTRAAMAAVRKEGSGQCMVMNGFIVVVVVVCWFAVWVLNQMVSSRCVVGVLAGKLG